MTSCEITMKLFLLAIALLPSFAAHAWGLGGLAYLNNPEPRSVYIQAPQVPTYSEEFNLGCNDAYMTSHGYPSHNGYGTAYDDGYRACWRP